MSVLFVVQQLPDEPARFRGEFALLVAGGIILTAIAIFLLVRAWQKQRAGRFAEEDDAVTEVASDGAWQTPQAYLLAEEEYNWAPAQIELYAGSKTTVGRNRSECTVQINDIGISRRHAMITSRSGHFYLSDSGSLGGTFLYRKKVGPHERQDRARLSAREERRLRDGDLVKFYTFAYRFQEGESTVVQNEHETQPTG